MARKLFCEISPLTYKISLFKECMIRNIKDILSDEIIAKKQISEELPNIVKSNSSILIRKLHGVDIKLQENKVTNIELACKKINGIVIKPGETFSYWKVVGKTTKKEGYKEGLVVTRQGLKSGFGGGLCQMANMIHWLVLNSPLTVTELHHHSDALFPDERRRVPFGTGTSVSYSNIDYRFKNTTDQDVQILVWCENGELCGELRSEKEYPYRYKLVEENHHFKKEGEFYYRISQVYRLVIDRKINCVDEAVVIAKKTEDGIVKSLKAFCVVNDDISSADIKKILNKSIPEYMIPNVIEIVDSIPLNGNFKINRKDLD